MAYFEDEKQDNDSVVEYIGPYKAVDNVVEKGTPMCHKHSDVLEEDREFDCDHDWTVDS